MRLAEGTTNAKARRRALVAGAVFGAMFACTSACAQDSGGGISSEVEARIARTFALVLGNTAELAIPLTRRALARRSIEDQEKIEPFPYSEPLPEAEPEFTAAVVPRPSDPPVAELEEGSAEEDMDVARLPRPRPDSSVESEEDDLANRPLDLVASAAVDTSGSDLVALQPPPTAPPSPLGPILAAAPGSPTPELVATGACLSPDEVTDKDDDFARNSDLLASSVFCIAEETFKEKRRTWTLQTIKTSRPGPLWVVMHDDEGMSFDNAVLELKTYGGTLVTVDTGGKRLLDGIDPNRNFSADGIGCRKLGTDAAPKFTAFFKDLFSSEQPIIALHNNYDGHVSTGGLGHVSMKSVPKDMRIIPALDENGPLAGEHSLVLLAADDIDDPIAASRTTILNAHGVNVVLEPVDKDKGDCSLSNYAIFTGHRDYFNVTVGHGEREKQQKIVDVIMAGRAEAVATQ